MRARASRDLSQSYHSRTGERRKATDTTEAEMTELSKDGCQRLRARNEGRGRFVIKNTVLMVLSHHP